jgi:hypothetical protein
MNATIFLSSDGLPEGVLHNVPSDEIELLILPPHHQHFFNNQHPFFTVPTADGAVFTCAPVCAEAKQGIFCRMQISCRCHPEACRTLRTDCRNLRETCRTLRTGCRSLRETCRTLRTDCRSLRETCRTLRTDCRSLRETCRTLRTGCRRRTVQTPARRASLYL